MKSQCCNASIIKPLGDIDMGAPYCSRCGTIQTPITPTPPQNFFELPDNTQREIITKATKESTDMQKNITTPPTTTVEGLKQKIMDKFWDVLASEDTDEAVERQTQAITRLIHEAELRGRYRECHQWLGFEHLNGTIHANQIQDRIKQLQAQLKGGHDGAE